MKKALILVGLMVVMSSIALAAISEQYVTPFDFPRRYGVERVTHYDPRVNYGRIDTTVYLEPAEHDKFKGVGRGGYAPFYASGVAKLRSSTWYGYPRAQATIKVKDLPYSDEEKVKFEAWLVDADTEYRLSMGTFLTTFGGYAEHSYRINNFFDPYEFVEITVEPLHDTDVRPGPVVVFGRIPDSPLGSTQYFNPEPRSSKMVTSSFESFG